MQIRRSAGCHHPIYLSAYMCTHILNFPSLVDELDMFLVKVNYPLVHLIYFPLTCSKYQSWLFFLLPNSNVYSFLLEHTNQFIIYLPFLTSLNKQNKTKKTFLDFSFSSDLLPFICHLLENNSWNQCLYLLPLIMFSFSLEHFLVTILLSSTTLPKLLLIKESNSIPLLNSMINSKSWSFLTQLSTFLLAMPSTRAS